MDMDKDKKVLDDYWGEGSESESKNARSAYENEGNSHENLDEASTSMNQHSKTIPTAIDLAMGIPLILQRIFQHLNVSSIKKVRQVCRPWNNAVIPILSKKSVIKLNTREKTKRFILKKIPSALFQNLYLVNSPNAIITSSELQELLSSNYGNNLSTLLVKGITVRNLHLLLENWCPNLKEVNYEVTEDDDYQPWQFRFDHPLNLQKITTAWNTINYDWRDEWFWKSLTLTTIIKSSSNLKDLKVDLDSPFQAILTTALENCSEIIKEVKALTISCNFEYFHTPSLSSYKATVPFMKELFSKSPNAHNLKYIYLTTGLYFIKHELITLLERVQDSLECLILKRTGDELYMNHSNEECLMLDLPILSKLKVFRTNCSEHLGVKSLELIDQKMPSLEALWIEPFSYSDSCPYHYEYYFPHLCEYFKPPWLIDQLLENVSDADAHTNIKELFLNSGFISAQTLVDIKTLFPNISTIGLEFNPKDAKDIRIHNYCKQQWLDLMFDGLAKFSVKNLCLWVTETEGMDFRGLTKLQVFLMKKVDSLQKAWKNKTGLQKLSILGSENQLPKKVKIPSISEELLAQLPLLKELNLVRCEGELSDIVKFARSLKDFGIELGVKDVEDGAPYLKSTYYY